MPTSTLDSTLNSINSITKKYFFPKLVDQVSTSMPLIMELKKRGRLETVDGGSDLRVPVRYTRNTSRGNYSGSETLNIAYVEKKFALIFDWKQKYVSVTITGLDKLKNAGSSKVIDHVKSEMEAAEQDMMDLFGTGIYSDGSTDPEDITGARAFLSTTATYAGISQSSNSWLQAKADTSTTTLTLSTLQTRYEAAAEPPDVPNYGTTTATLFSAYMNLLQPQQRFSNTEIANAGFSNVLYRGMPLVEDSYCPSSYLILWNLKHVKLVSHKDRNFPGDFTGFKEPVNQDVSVGQILWAGEMICEQPRKQGFFSALTA